MGVADRQGRLIIDTMYNYISPSESSGVFAIRKGDSIKCITATGRDILPFYYVTDTALYPFPMFRDGLLCVMVKTGKELHKYKVGFVIPVVILCSANPLWLPE
jgi:hypothetical protein